MMQNIQKKLNFNKKTFKMFLKRGLHRVPKQPYLFMTKKKIVKTGQIWTWAHYCSVSLK